MIIDSHLNLTNHELQNANIQVLASDPVSPTESRFYYNSVTKRPRIYNGAVWIELNTGAGDVSQSGNSAAGGILKVSGGSDKTITDYAGGAGIIKSNASGVVSQAIAGTDYVTATSSNTFTNKVFDANGTGNTISNIETADFAAGVLNTSTTLAGATNSQVPSAAAVKSVTDALATSISNVVANADAFVAKGAIDCSTNPNYPAADAGWTYRVSVAGRIGGASGPLVGVGDLLTCWVDATASGNEATVGANWEITQNELNAATTTTPGFVTLATQSEANAQSDSSKVVTPAALADYSIVQNISFGNGALTTFTIAHGRGSNSVTAEVYNNSTNQKHYPDIEVNSVNVVISGYLTAPTASQYRVIIVG